MISTLLNPYYTARKRSPQNVISVHIPRTAGTSFKKTLDYVYGYSAVKTVYDEPTCKVFRAKQIPVIAKRTRVIHGHMPANQQLIDHFKNPFLVTWIREPFDRAVSHYFYWKQMKYDGSAVHHKFLSNEYTLPQFVKEFHLQNQVASLFSYIPIEQFNFIGQVENYNQDLERLSNVLHWKKTPVFKVNNATKAYISESEKKETINLLKKEYMIYDKALAIIHQQNSLIR